MGQLQKLDDKLKLAKSVKDLFTIPDVKERFIKNYQAVSGKTDGENRWEQERYAYLEIVAGSPDLRKADNFYHFASIVKAGTTGLSFRDNKLYVIPVKNRQGDVIGIKVQSSPAGKREQMEMMPNITKVPEPKLVMVGDHFIHDKRNDVVKEHWTTDKTKEKIAYDNIRAAYTTIYWKDKSITDVVVYIDDILKAKTKSKTKSDDSFPNEWPGEFSKKVTINRAFRLYHKYPDNVIVYGSDVDEDDDETKDIGFTEEPTAPEVQQDDYQEAEVVSKPKQEQAPPPTEDAFG